MKPIKLVLQRGLIPMFQIFTACNGGNNQHVTNHGDSTAGQKMAPMHPGVSMTEMHRQYNNPGNKFAHNGIIVLDHPYQVDGTTSLKMDRIINTNLSMEDALFQENVDKADNEAALMYNTVMDVVPDKLDKEGLKAWQNHQLLYEAKLMEMMHIKELENKRSCFNHISEKKYCTIKGFGLRTGGLYAVYCPMAFNKKGAYLISDSKVVQNPYAGSKMPDCGEVQETL